MSGHTKGPWRVDPENIRDIQTADGTFEIATSAESVLVGGFCPSVDEQRANARLIAAAPDYHENAAEGVKLVEDLWNFTRKIGDLETRDRCAAWLDKQRAAIAMAEGR